LSITDDQLEAVLRDKRAPYGLTIGMDKARLILVSELVRLAKLHVGEQPHLERRLDEYVTSIGGYRYDPISLDHLAERFVRRLRGRTSPKAPESYAIPWAFFAPEDA
jgi:hypothetical protein